MVKGQANQAQEQAKCASLQDFVSYFTTKQDLKGLLGS